MRVDRVLSWTFLVVVLSAMVPFLVSVAVHEWLPGVPLMPPWSLLFFSFAVFSVLMAVPFAVMCVAELGGKRRAPKA